MSFRSVRRRAAIDRKTPEAVPVMRELLQVRSITKDASSRAVERDVYALVSPDQFFRSARLRGTGGLLLTENPSAGVGLYRAAS